MNSSKRSVQLSRELTLPSEYMKYNSLLFLTPENKVRQFCEKVKNSRPFEKVVIALILINCVFLIATEPFGSCCEQYMINDGFQVVDPTNFSLFCNANNLLEVENVQTDTSCCIDYSVIKSDVSFSYLSCASQSRKNVQNLADRILNVCFTIEFFIKVIAMGFIGHKGSYLRDGWNVLDFVVVLFGWLSEIPGMNNVSGLRTFRVLRPLRTLSSVKGMRPVVSALFASVPALANIFGLALFVFVVFGVLGVQLFGGTLTGRCHYVDPSGVGDFQGSNPYLSIFSLNQEDETPCPLPCAPSTVDGDPDLTTGDWSRISYSGCLSMAGSTCGDRGTVIIDNPWYDASAQGEIQMNTQLLPAGGPWVSNIEKIGINESFAKLNDTFGVYTQLFNKSKPFVEVQSYCLNTRENQLGDGYAKFDTFGYSILLIFTSITLEGWVDVMYAINATFGREVFVVIYFFGMVMFCAFFMLELVLAVIADEYDSASEEEEKIMQEKLEKQIEEAEKQGKISAKEIKQLREKAENAKQNERKEEKIHPWGPPKVQAIFYLVTSNWFNNTITVFIIVNTIFMAKERFPESNVFSEPLLDTANLVFTIVFFIEMILKQIGLGLRQYFRDRMNTFDFLIVWISVFELLLAKGEGGGGGLGVLRTFRLLRVFKLVRSWKSLRTLVTTIMLGLKDCLIPSILVAVLMLIFTLLGMQIFGGKLNASKFCDDPENYDSCKGDTPRANFDTFWNGFVTVFQILTGENWNEVLYSGLVALDGSPSVVLYYVFLNVVGNYMVLNLFLAVLLARFEGGDDDDGDDEEEKKEEPTPKQISVAVTPMPEFYPSTDKELVESMKVPDEDPNKIKVHPTAKAFYVLSVDNPVRVKALQVATNQTFDNIILFLIFVSTLCLIIDEPWIQNCLDFKLEGCTTTDDNLYIKAESLSKTLWVLDVVMNSIFTMEMLIRMVALGLIGHKYAYLRDGWNILDFGIVLVSWLSMAGSGGGLKALRALRSLRALRPLRVVSRFPGMKLVVNSLIMALPESMRVLMIGLLFFGILAITGVQFFKGTTMSCNDPSVPVGTTEDDCLGIRYWTPTGSDCSVLPTSALEEICRKNGTGGCATCFDGHGFPRIWEPVPTHFDNINNALLVVFEIASGEMWPDIMYILQDGQGVNMPMYEWPHKHNQGVPIYFMMVTLVCCWIMVSIVIGVIVDNFNQMKDKQNGSGLLTEEQKQWVETMKKSMSEKPIKKLRPPKHPLRLKLWDLVEGKPFEIFIMLMIIMNTVFLCIDGRTDKNTANFLEAANLVFQIIFTIEFLLKFIALELQYFKVKWNIFDFTLVVLGYVGYIGGLGPIASLLRLFRIARVFRLLKTSDGLLAIFKTFIISLPSIVNVGTILLLMMMIFAVIFMNIFANVKHGGLLNEDANFSSFWGSFKVLFRMATGESFNGIMHDCMIQEPYCSKDEGNCGDVTLAPILFCFYFILSGYMLLSMITAIVLDNFGETMSAKSALVTQKDIDQFKEAWAELDPEGTMKIEETQMRRLVKMVAPPLGVLGAPGDGSSRKKAGKLLQNLNIPVFNGQVNFKDVLTELTNNAMGGISVDKINPVIAKLEETKKLERVKTLKKMGTSLDLIEYNTAQKSAIMIVQAAMRGYIFRRRLDHTEEENLKDESTELSEIHDIHSNKEQEHETPQQDVLTDSEKETRSEDGAPPEEKGIQPQHDVPKHSKETASQDANVDEESQPILQ